MTASAHERYRDRLALLATAPEPPWARHFARFQPGRAPWATLVDGCAGSMPLMLTTEVYDSGAAPAQAIATAAGPAHVCAFPADPQLPALARVVRSLDGYDIVRYRPGRRCTLRTGAPDGARYVKVLAVADGERIISEARQLWVASHADAFEFLVARPDHFDAANGAVWHHEVPGHPIQPLLFGPHAVRLAHALGAALAQLAQAPVVPARHSGRADQIARTERAIGRVAVTVPDVADGLRECASALNTAARALPPERVVLIHGSPHMHQWLIDGDRLGLVDFDRLAHGEAEHDVATFLGELEAERGLAVAIGDIEAAVHEGFQQLGSALVAPVVDWYLAHKRIAKVARTACALRPDGDRRAARLLSRGQRSHPAGMCPDG